MRFFLKLLLVFGVAIQPCSIIPIAYAEETASEKHSDLMKKVQRSVCRLFVQTKHGISTGTGFFAYGDGWMITNCHVVEDAEDVVVFVLSTDLQSAQAWPAVIVVSDTENDLCLLKVAGENLPNPLGISLKSAEVLEEVIAVGYPGAIDSRVPKAARLENGYTNDSSILENLTPNITKGAVSKSTSRFITHDAKIAKGNSGGPLISLQSGMVVGVNTAGIKDSMSTFYMAVPSEHIIKLAHKGFEKEESGETITKDTTSIGESDFIPQVEIVSQDEAKSIIDKANEGNAQAQLEAARLYLSGNGVKRDINKAIYFYQQAANAKNSLAMVELAQIYFDGEGVEKNIKKYEQLLNAAMDLGNGDAAYRLGSHYVTSGKNAESGFAKAYNYFDKAAKLGHNEATLWSSLGLCYQFGYGTKVNISKAREYYEKALLIGDETDKYSLAKFLHQHGRNKEDAINAEKLMIESAESGYTPAQVELGIWYTQGLGVEEDILKAINYFARAAEAGDAYAQTNLGKMYLNGQGVSPNLTEAKRLLAAAAKQGIPHAHFLLGHLYDKLGDQLMAVRHEQEAAKLGEPHAALALAVRYHFGKGVMRNEKQEIKWLKVAASQSSNKKIRDQARKLLTGKSAKKVEKKRSSDYRRSNQPQKERYRPKPAAKPW